MLNALIIGLGRSGLGLHIPALTRLRLCATPIVAVDPYQHHTLPKEPPITVLRTLRAARGLLAPESTVVHLCTPPAVRADVLREVAALGFARIIVEKPLATGEDELEQVLQLTHDYGLRLSVVTPWLHSTLTSRLIALLESGGLGRLLTVTVAQHKPRFRRSLTSRSHDSAFDVEIPHSLGLALRLAGDAEVTGARSTDLDLGDTVLKAMGSAHITLHHICSGVRTTIDSDLASPIRQRRVILQLTGGRIVADYPIGQDDDYAQLQITYDDRVGDTPVRQILRDDALGTFLSRAYHRYATGIAGAPASEPDLDPELELDQQVRGCRLLLDAKRHAFARKPLERRPLEQMERMERTP
jgi:predicted dehydrogenase